MIKQHDNIICRQEKDVFSVKSSLQSRDQVYKLSNFSSNQDNRECRKKLTIKHLRGQDQSENTSQ